MAKSRKSRPPAAKSARPVQRMIRKLGWIPDLPDLRDKVFAAPRAIGPLPASVDLRPGCPAVYDQGQLGSCTANAIGAAVQFDQMKQGLADVFVPSRLFIYYNERVMEGSVDEDAGAMIRDGIKSVSKQGAPHEELWPYTVSKFRTKPPASVYKDAAKHQALLYQRVTQQIDQLKGCLASGYPFVFGFAVYESFQTQAVAKSGKVPMPSPTEKQLGGHAVLAVGYDDAKERFIVRNSWGPDWATKGYYTMPYAYLLDENLSDDFWVIKLVEE
jgi:C1A family cysteine protease